MQPEASESILPCDGCELPVIRKLPHQICTGWACHGLVWCLNCLPHSTHRGIAAVPRGVGHP